jgi:hypothetical protein
MLSRARRSVPSSRKSSLAIAVINFTFMKHFSILAKAPPRQWWLISVSLEVIAN